MSTQPIKPIPAWSKQEKKFSSTLMLQVMTKWSTYSSIVMEIGKGKVFLSCMVQSLETGKVVEYIVKSKHCAGSKYWEKQDKTMDAYKKWKDAHECGIILSEVQEPWNHKEH